MVNFNQLKALGTDLIGKAGELAGQAKEKAGPLAAQAKEKAGPLAEQAKVKATPLVGKAKDAAAKGVDLAADKIDDATGHKYSGKIESVSDRLGTKATTPPVASPFDTPTTTGMGDPFASDPLSTATPVAPLSDSTFAETPIRDEIIEPYPPTLPPAPGSTI